MSFHSVRAHYFLLLKKYYIVPKYVYPFTNEGQYHFFFTFFLFLIFRTTFLSLLLHAFNGRLLTSCPFILTDTTMIPIWKWQVFECIWLAVLVLVVDHLFTWQVGLEYVPKASRLFLIYRHACTYKMNHSGRKWFPGYSKK